MGADPAFVATPSSRQGVSTEGFNRGASDLQRRIAKLIDPLRGIKRGIIDRIEAGKGSPDRDDKLIPVSVGEIREVHAVLTAIAKGAEE